MVDLPAFDALRPWIGLALIVAIFLSFVLERVPAVVTALAGAALMVGIGLVTPPEMLSVFANPAPVAVGAMFVLSGALVRTGVIERLANLVAMRARARPRSALFGLFGGTLTLPAFINNTPVVILMIPIVKRLAAATGIASTRLLIPLSYFAIMSGTLTLIGTSTNLLVDGVAQQHGQPAFGIFEITPVGIVVALSGALMLLLLGPWLLPDRPDRDAADGELQLFLTELSLTDRAFEKWHVAGEIAPIRRGEIKLLGIRRKGQVVRRIPEDFVLIRSDVLVVAANAHELDALARGHDFVVGLQSVGEPIKLSDDDRDEDLTTIVATIAPTHPAIGRRVQDIPFLSRLPVRILGLSRSRHRAGPDLANAHLRAADQLLVTATPEGARGLRENVNLIGIDTAQARRFRRGKAPIAALTLAGVVALAALKVAPIAVLAIIGIAVVLLTRCIDAEEAWRSVDGNVLVLILCMLVIGIGVQNAGTIELVIQWLTPTMAGLSPLMVVVLIYMITSVLTEMVTNNAVAVLMAPIAMGAATTLGMDPRPLLVAVMFAASASFATPIGYQTNTMVYAAADYRFSDFVKIGLPMNVVVGLSTCLGIYFLML